MARPFRLFLYTAFICANATAPAIAQTATDATPQATAVQALELSQERALRSLEFTRDQTDEARAQLRKTRAELADKQQQLKQLEASLANGATPAQLETFKQEQQRLAVSELSLQSQQAKLERLERKEEELKQRLEQAKNQIIELTDNQRIAEREARVQKAQELERLQQQVQQLRNRNEILEIAINEERQRRIRAEDRVTELVANNDRLTRRVNKLDQALAQLSTPPASPAQAVTASSETTTRLGLQTTALEGEEPIYDGEDGEQIIMRSRSIEDNAVFEQIGPELYQAEVRVEPGRAYFDLRRRRYRGEFPADHEGAYRFFYDLSDPEQPVMTVEKITNSEAMVTGAEGF